MDKGLVMNVFHNIGNLYIAGYGMNKIHKQHHRHQQRKPEKSGKLWQQAGPGLATGPYRTRLLGIIMILYRNKNYHAY
jgi:hypothetical protein